MTGIRIEGTPEEINEVVRRLRHVLWIGSEPKIRDKRENPDSVEKYCYLRAYFYNRNTILDQLEAADRDYAELTIQYGDLLKDYDKLKQQLGLLQEPRLYDAVLSPKHDSSRLPSNLG